jgi:outer membrane protein OmpA-like peptidoglycan-associated protein
MATLSANDPDGDRLTFSWTVDNRALPGTGTTATINTSGMAGGSHTVTVTARDERGATCTDTENFSVRERITIDVDNRVDNVAKARLDEIALRMQQNPRLRATLTGHTDSPGSEEANQAAGLRRANLVKDYLVNERNIDANRIETRSAGESQPIASNDTEEGRKRNRRVEIELFVP